MAHLGQYFAGKRVLVTGNTGFKGSWLSLILSQYGAEVFGYSDTTEVSKPCLFNSFDFHAKTIIGDITDYNRLLDTLNKTKPHYIFHLAAQPIVSVGYNRPLYTFNTNALGTATLCEAVRNRSYKGRIAVVVITSDKCYENKETYYGYRETDELSKGDPYSASKACAEFIIASYVNSFFYKTETLVCSVRAGNVVGGGDFSENRIVPDIYRCWQSNDTLMVRSPQSIRPWQHVFDPLNGYLMLASRLYLDDALNGQAFNFGPTHNSKLRVVDIVELFKDRQPNFDYKIISRGDFHEYGLLSLNIDKAVHLLGWRPILEDIMFDEVFEWYERYAIDSRGALQFTIGQIERYNKLSEIRL